MIFTLVVLLLLIVFLAFFVGKNLSNVCTFWIFKTFTNLPVAILALICFGSGIVVSILVYLIAKLKKAASEDRIENAKEAVLKQQEKSKAKTKKEIKRLEKKNKKNLKIDSKNENNSSEIDDSGEKVLSVDYDKSDSQTVSLPNEKDSKHLKLFSKKEKESQE